MKQLILCERPFMVYKAILKAMNTNDSVDIVLSNHMPGLEKLYQPLVDSHIFHKVFYYDDALYQEYIRDEKLSEYVKFPDILWKWPKKFVRYLRYQRLARKKKKPKGLDFRCYDEILANDGVSALNFMLNFEKIPYVASEHGRGNFRNKVPLHILAVYISIVLDYLHIAVAYSASSKYVKAVEVDKNEGLVGYITRRKKVRECRISELESALTDGQKDKVYKIYAQAFGLPDQFEEEINLLLTGPLAHDGILASEEDQLNCYEDAVSKYCDKEKKLLIKPHPRDSVNYAQRFPDALMIDKIVTSEVLSFCSSLKIDKVITIYSSSVPAFQKAKDMVVLGDSFLNGYHRISNAGKCVVPADDLHSNNEIGS